MEATYYLYVALFLNFMKISFLKKLDNKKQAAHVIFGIVAVLSCVALILTLANFFGLFKNDSKGNTHNHTGVPSPEKSFTMFIDPKMFTSEKNDNVTTVTAIKDASICLTAQAIRGTSYTALCEKYKGSYTQIYDYAELNTDLPYNVYQSTSEKIVTTVYCVDDGAGSGVEIKYTYPSDDEEHKKGFDILLSTFKLIS